MTKCSKYLISFLFHLKFWELGESIISLNDHCHITLVFSTYSHNALLVSWGRPFWIKMSLTRVRGWPRKAGQQEWPVGLLFLVPSSLGGLTKGLMPCDWTGPGWISSNWFIIYDFYELSNFPQRSWVGACKSLSRAACPSQCQILALHYYNPLGLTPAAFSKGNDFSQRQIWSQFILLALRDAAFV